MRYLARYTDRNGNVHEKEYETQAEVEMVYSKLQRIKEKHGITNIQALDCKYCCQFFGSYWD